MKRLSLLFVALPGLVLGCASNRPAQQPTAPGAQAPELPQAGEDADAPPRPTVTERVPERKTPDAPFRAELPKTEPLDKFDIPDVKRFTLSNGLPVILTSDNRLPLVYLQMVVKTGSGANPPQKAGLAELTADMLDEGTKTRSALEISRAIEQLGASLTTEASWDASYVSLSGLTDKMDQALPVWADVILNPAFDEQELARVKTNLLAALAKREDNPPVVANIVFHRALYGDKHPMGWPGSGTQDSVKDLQASDLARYHQRYYKPGDAVLIVAGDMTEADVRAKVEPLFKGWKGKGAKEPRVPAAAKTKKTTVVLVNKQNAPQSSIRVGLVGIRRKNPDYYKAMVMNEILGGSFRRLTLNLREKRGWTYGVYSRFTPNREPGPWLVSGEFVANKTAESVQEIIREIEALRDNPVPEDELREAKDSIIKAYPAYFATMTRTASQMARLVIHDLPPSELEQLPGKIAAVTAKDVQQMARKYLQSGRLTIVVVGDRDTNEAALERIGDLELRDVEGNPLDKGVEAQAKP